jgi:hypothetical protein
MNLNLRSLAFGVFISIFLAACGKVPPRPFDFKDVTHLPTAPNDHGNDPDDAGDDGQGHNDDGSSPPPSYPQSQYCVPDVNGIYSQDITLDSGPDQAPAQWWAAGGTCILRPIRDVWSVLHNYELLKWDGVDDIEVTGLPPPQNDVIDYDSVKYIVHNFITVSWTMEWVHALSEGSLQDPKQVVVRYQRVSGTHYVPFWEGYIVLHKLTDTVTGVEMLDRLKASRTGENDCRGNVTDLIAKMRTGR